MSIAPRAEGQGPKGPTSAEHLGRAVDRLVCRSFLPDPLATATMRSVEMIRTRVNVTLAKAPIALSRTHVIHSCLTDLPRRLACTGVDAGADDAIS
jgi:hypothetical protein